MDGIKRKLHQKVFKLALEMLVPLPFTKSKISLMDISSYGALYFQVLSLVQLNKACKDWTSGMPSEISHREQNIDIIFKTFCED